MLRVWGGHCPNVLSSGNPSVQLETWNKLQLSRLQGAAQPFQRMLCEGVTSVW